MIVKLTQGHRIFVGMNLPFYVPASLVEAKLQTLGMANFVWFERGNPGVKLDVNPTEDPLYTDDWTKWLEADYAGPTTAFEEKKIWSWLVTKQK